MKKILVFFLFVGTFGACKKESKPLSTNPNQSSINVNESLNPEARVFSGVSVVNGILTFASINDFKEAMDFEDDDWTDTAEMVSQPKMDEWIEFANGLSFNSLLNNESAESGLNAGITDEIPKSFLNTDGLVAVGDYVFKLHPQDCTLFILAEAANTRNAVDISNLKSMDLSKVNITSASMLNGIIQIIEKYQEDVTIGGYAYNFKTWWAENIDENTYRTTGLFCGQNGAGARSASETLYLGDGGSVKCMVKYNRFGVYFSLLWHIQPSGAGSWVMNTQNYPYAYRKKCSYSVGPMYQPFLVWATGMNGTDYKHHYYSNIQPLNKYWLKVVFSATRVSYPSVGTDLQIKVGY